MIEKTKGIVLHSLRYAETSVIIKVLTRSHGLQAYIVPGVRKARSKAPNNLFQALTLIDLVAYHKNKGGLQHIKEVSCAQSYASIPYDILKSSVAIFLSEMLVKSLKEGDANPDMFDYVTEALLYFDQIRDKSADFHLYFLIQLTRFLGFQPRNNFDLAHSFFNLKEGLFQRDFDDNNTCLDKQQSLIFHQINTSGLRQLGELSISGSLRRSLLKKTIDYYSHHLEGFHEVRSHLVLEAVLST